MLKTRTTDYADKKQISTGCFRKPSVLIREVRGYYALLALIIECPLLSQR